MLTCLEGMEFNMLSVLDSSLKGEPDVQQRGVPQGSTLVPLLFSINNLSFICSNSAVWLFVYDADIHTSKPQLLQIQTDFQSESIPTPPM